MRDPEKCAFVVLLTVGSGNNTFTRPVFVMAANALDAQKQTLEIATQRMPDVAGTVMQVFVIDGSSLSRVLPDIKAIARAYYQLGANAGEAIEPFDEVWERDGVDLVKEQ